MRRFLVFFMLAVFLGLAVSSSALAAGIGVSPPSVEFEVPSDGSAEVAFNIYSDSFEGDVEVGLENIPLQIEPQSVHIENIAGPQQVVLTFYGDPSLGEQTFQGKITFLALTGGTVAMGIKVKATVNHTVEGLPLPEEEGEGEGFSMPLWGWIAIGVGALGVIVFIIRRRVIYY